MANKQRLDTQKRYRERNREEIRRKDRAYVAARKDTQEYKDNQRRYRLKRWYGITLEQYNNLVKVQVGLCAICKREPSGTGQLGSLHVDHDHVTGKTRGLLCNTCNALLGYYEKHKSLIGACAEYAGRYKD